MKITLKELMDSSQALQKLASDKLPAKAAYIIGRNIQKIDPEIENYEKQRISLIRDKYGEEKEDGSFIVKPENMQDFIKELSELQEIELDLDIRTIKLSSLTSDISPIDLLSLDWMIEDDTE